MSTYFQISVEKSVKNSSRTVLMVEEFKNNDSVFQEKQASVGDIFSIFP